MPTPLADVLRCAASGTFPEIDGRCEHVTPWHPRIEAVVAFTGHAYLAVRDDLAAAAQSERVDGFGGAHDPRVIATLAGDGWIDSLDALLVHPGDSARTASLVDRPDLADHPRARFAQRVRTDLRVLGRADHDDGSLVTVSRGVAGLTEIGVEAGGAGPRGRALVEAALRGLHGPVVAAVAPGNARALRSFLAVGFVPVGSVQLFERKPLRTGD